MLVPLGREEYIEQAYFFGTLAERLQRNQPAQDVIATVREEILATTKLPLALDFLLGELRHLGALAAGMRKLNHYFSAFQAFVVEEAENERGRFDLRIGLQILRREAEYRAADPSVQGLFLYQFESICRNRLGYDRGLAAIGADPAFDSEWSAWIETLRRRIGAVDVADLIYVRSAFYKTRTARRQSSSDAESPSAAALPPPLFGEREGRIALANRRKDPLILFASLHRQLGYPDVPRIEPGNRSADLLPALARRLEQLESRLKLVEEEQRGGIDLTRFYTPPPPGE